MVRIRALTRSHDLPSVLMNFHVVSVAEEHKVLEVRLAAVRPVDQVMRRAPFGGSVAAGPNAPAVARIQCSSLLWQYRAPLPADVEHDRLRVKEDPRDACVAREPAHGLGAHGFGEVDVGGF
jgi:hypothetical protein